VVPHRRDDANGWSTAAVLAIVALAVAVVALLVALTRPASKTRVVAAPTTTTTVATCASTAADLSDFVAKVHQQGHAAYVSGPVRVTGNGTYSLLFGPITAQDAARFTTPMAGGLSFPIMERQFSPNVDRQRMTKVTMNGATYIRAPMTVTDFRAPCTALRVLIQY
jgi:hypothetical protein